MQPIAATYMDGQSSQLWHISLVALGTDLIISETDGKQLAIWPLKSLRIHVVDSNLAHIQSSLFSEAIIYADPRLLTNHKWFHTRKNVLFQSKIQNIVALLVVLIAFVVGLYFAVEPLSTLITKSIPVSIDSKIGDIAIKQIPFELKKDARSEKILLQLAKKLTNKRKMPYPLKVKLIDSHIENAFALPGGRMLVGCGIIKSAKSPDEVAGILAHEIQHHISRHNMRSLVRSAVLFGSWQIALGDYTGIFLLDPSTIYSIAMQKYSRSNEDEADIGAIAMLADAKISPAPAAEFFHRNSKGMENIPEFLLSHPNSKSRRKKFANSLVPGKRYKKSMADADWTLLRNACGSEIKPNETLNSIRN